MRFSVLHETRYRYSAPVRLAEHRLRLTPRGGNVTVIEQSLTVDPAPAIREDASDRFGNPVTRIAFEGASDHLTIESRFLLEAQGSPPADGTLPPLPWTANVVGAGLGDYLTADAVDEPVRAFAAGLAAENGRDAHAFLNRLNRALFTRTDRHIRATGAAQEPARTLATGKGACRDLAVLFMAACRSLGIPARFVSGYQARAESVDGQRHLHAWPEVFLPGFGWRGFDPTHGVAVSDGHVALSAAPDQAATMPVEGGYYGDGISVTLDYEIRIAADD